MRGDGAAGFLSLRWGRGIPPPPPPRPHVTHRRGKTHPGPYPGSAESQGVIFGDCHKKPHRPRCRGDDGDVPEVPCPVPPSHETRALRRGEDARCPHVPWRWRPPSPTGDVSGIAVPSAAPASPSHPRHRCPRCPTCLVGDSGLGTKGTDAWWVLRCRRGRLHPSGTAPANAPHRPFQ